MDTNKGALHDTYTRLLRYVLGIKWQDYQTNAQVNIQPVSERLRSRRLKFIGLCAHLNSYICPATSMPAGHVGKVDKYGRQTNISRYNPEGL